MDMDMDHQDEIESLWQRVYNSTDPDAVLADFFSHKPPGQRERLLRRCYSTGEQFGLHLQQQELTWCTALAYIYAYGLQTCSAQQLQITPSPDVAGLIKDRRYQLYATIQRRPGWRQFPFNIHPSNIWRYKNKKEYLGQDILRLYGKLAYRTPDFNSARALLRKEYQSGGNKRLTKPALTKIIDRLPTTVPGIQTFNTPGPPATLPPVDRDDSSLIDIERPRRHPQPTSFGDDISDVVSPRSSLEFEPDSPRSPNNPDRSQRGSPPPLNNSNRSQRESPPPNNSNQSQRDSPPPNNSNRSQRDSPHPNNSNQSEQDPDPPNNLDQSEQDPTPPNNSNQSEQDPAPPNNLDQPEAQFSDSPHTGTPARHRSFSQPLDLFDQLLQSASMTSRDGQQNKRSRPLHEEPAATAFKRVITEATATAKHYDNLAVEVTHLENVWYSENSGITGIHSRWQVACDAKSKAEKNLIAQKEIYTSLQGDSDDTSNLKEDIAGLVDRWEARVLESEHNADSLKAELDESRERVNCTYENLKVKVAEMVKIGQDWGWGERHSEVYETYRWIGKTFGKAGAEAHCKEHQDAVEMARSNIAGG